MPKSTVKFELFLALIKFPEWNTKDFVKMGFKRTSVYLYRKHLIKAQRELSEMLRK